MGISAADGERENLLPKQSVCLSVCLSLLQAATGMFEEGRKQTLKGPGSGRTTSAVLRAKQRRASPSLTRSQAGRQAASELQTRQLLLRRHGMRERAARPCTSSPLVYVGLL
mmetsp:Transcript_13457/g.25943  ORF Transcript_13457/g.25943 Transcript_13457/m.25943 type:complete len:112 (-) Transcript_13457:1440-1775(-)